MRAAQRWSQDLLGIFVELLTQMWAKIRAGKHSGSRFWRIAPSEVPPDKRYIKAHKDGGGWGIDPDAGSGNGLWCAKAGKHEIVFDGPASVSKPVTKPVKKSQSCYIIKMPGPSSNNEVFAPTVQALQVGAVSHGFIVQHSRENPTHKISWEDHLNVPCYEPIRRAEVNEEFTIDYGWEESEHVESEDDSDSN